MLLSGQLGRRMIYMCEIHRVRCLLEIQFRQFNSIERRTDTKDAGNTHQMPPPDPVEGGSFGSTGGGTVGSTGSAGGAPVRVMPPVADVKAVRLDVSASMVKLLAFTTDTTRQKRRFRNSPRSPAMPVR